MTALAERPWTKVARVAGILRRSGRPKYVLGLPQAGFGDQLFCTAAFHELRRRGTKGLWAASFFPDLFANNPDVDAVVPPWRAYFTMARAMGATVKFPHHIEDLPGGDRWTVPPRHVLAELCQRAGVRGTISLRPYLYLTEEERTAGVWCRGKVCMMSSGLNARHPMHNREWGVAKFQAVADELRRRYELVQIGSPKDPLLGGAEDRRGLPFRETAAALSHAAFYVGQDGFQHHLARAVDCRSAMVFGGFGHPYQIGYVCNENLSSSPPCAPCWAGNACDRNRVCMSDITPEMVLGAVARLETRLGQPLEVETAEV